MISLITTLAPIFKDVIERVISDPKQRLDVEREFNAAVLSNEAKIYEAAASVVKAEASSTNVLASSWRPILMYFLMGVIAWIIGAATFADATPIVEALGEVPENLWHLITIGMGGYVVGRSVEKGIREWRSPGD